ncbi:MAG: ATP-grasp domain-containing protein [Deltaproteobacteria bacterium]|nr:ATP-grasp domain-containing protein [Deltaproteobacteria bacterium]
MAKKPLKLLLLFDIGEKPPENQDFTEIFKHDDWKPEVLLVRALKNLGHDVKPFGLFDDIRPLIDEVTRDRPDLVFNQCEAFRGGRQHEPNAASLLELLDLKYTGASAHALQICKDKSLTKKILSFHRIRVPRFVVSKKARPLRKLPGFAFPAFTKPLKLEASEGIAQMSFADNEKDALDRVRFIHESLGTDAIVEEYIEGRELYVGVLGNERLKILPTRELFFAQVPDGEPKFATFKAKWDDNYRKKWGIKGGAAKPIAPKAEKHLADVSRKIYQLFQVRGFARIDFRLTPADEIVFLEANPNPSLAKDDDFALAAEKAGITYEQLLEQIIALAT